MLLFDTGVKDDGNVFDPANIESLMHFVMDHTDQQGVHFMMADGVSVILKFFDLLHAVLI